MRFIPLNSLNIVIYLQEGALRIKGNFFSTLHPIFSFIFIFSFQLNNVGMLLGAVIFNMISHSQCVAVIFQQNISVDPRAIGEIVITFSLSGQIFELRHDLHSDLDRPKVRPPNAPSKSSGC